MSNSIGERKKLIVDQCLNRLSLGAVLQYIVYRFLQSTMFGFFYSNTYKLITMFLLLCFGGIRYVRLVYKKYINNQSSVDQRKYILKCGLVWLLAVPLVYVGWKHDYKVLIFLPICCMCLYQMESEKVLKAYACVIGILVSATVLCCLSGTVRNLVYDYEELNGKLVGAYGFINTTDFASYFTFLLLAVWCSMRDSRWYKQATFIVFSIVLSAFLYWLTKSRTVISCGIIIALLAIWNYLDENVLKNNPKLDKTRKRINALTLGAFPVIGLLVFVLVICYGNQQQWAIQINTFLSDRLKETWNAYQEYGVHLFGSAIESMHGNGGTTIGKWSSGIRYLDIAYAMITIRYGLVILVIITGGWICITKQALSCNKKRIALAMTVLAIHAFSESRIIDVNYNMFLIMPFCALVKEEEQNEKDLLYERKKYTVSFISCVVILGSVYLALPTILSWLRTFFSLKGWNYGTHAAYSLATCACVMLLFWILWRSISLVWEKRNRKAVLLPTFALIAIIGIVLAVDGTINKGLTEQADRLDSEEKAIRLVQESASLPVYAAEESEIYRRRFGGFDDHIFSTEELYRGDKGTIITDRSIDALRIIRTGGMYTALSEWSGLYTYDSSVITALEKEGYEWFPYYNGKKTCDLEDLALFNGLEYSDKLVLNGPIRVATTNCETDQYSARYEANISMTLLSRGKEELVCVVEILGEAGEKVIRQEEIFLSDFDSNGECYKTIPYSCIYSTPRVSYAIIVEDGVSLCIDEISWKRRP